MTTSVRVRVLGDGVELRPGWERLLLSAAPRLDPRPESPLIVVLGDDAILKLKPEDIRRPEHDSLALVLLPRACAYATMARWCSGRRVVVATDMDLEATVRSLARSGIGVRTRSPPGEWFPQPLRRGSLTWTALEALDDCEVVHDIAAWAEALGLTRQTLWSQVLEETGLTPSDVARLYAHRQVTTALERGYSKAAAARALGYSDTQGLNKALRRGEALLSTARRKLG